MGRPIDAEQEKQSERTKKEAVISMVLLLLSVESYDLADIEKFITLSRL